MSNISIRSSRKTQGGAVLALLMLAVLYFAKWGPTLGSIQDTRNRELDAARTRELILNTPPEAYQDIGKALRENGAAKQALEDLHNFLDEQEASKETAAPPSAPLENERSGKPES